MTKPTPTHLYHGTAGKYLKSILKNGLQPRGTHKARNNWKHVAHTSNPRAVYLTDSYAPYFAHNACDDRDDAVIIEIAIDRLDRINLFPDEDFLEQVSRRHDDISVTGLSPRTLYYRKRQFKYAAYIQCDGEYPTWWESSVGYLGTCCHRGTMPADAITRIVRYPIKSNLWLNFKWDPTITLINQRICGDRYRELTRRLFAGEFISCEQMKDPDALSFDERFVALPTIKGWTCETINP